MLDLPLMLAKSFLLAQLTVCPVPDAIPTVDVIFKPSKPEYITGAPIKALTDTMKGNKDATHISDTTRKWRVFGLTEAGVGGGSYNVKYNGLSDNAGNTCIYVESVEMVITYTPTIFIGKELQTSECHFKVTKMHEERHVAADLKVIKEYLPKLKMEILWYLRGVAGQGPYPQYETPKNTKRIVEEVIAYVRPMVQKLVDTRRARQSDIDTLENYKYESGLCPGDMPKIEE
ncbi:MAG: hypothetical protein PSY14_03140 [bacterium]|nr:hypothetical protein [bacterium]